MSWFSRHRRKWYALLVFCAALVVTHAGIRLAARTTPPAFEPPKHTLTRTADGTLHFGEAKLEKRGGILEVSLSGTPSEIGFAHASLLRERMVANERVLLGALERTIPNVLARATLLDLALLRYGNVSKGMSSERLLEIAAAAKAFEPDPFRGFLDTFQRFTYLNALYDIALSFEHSPLIGCTSFVLNAAPGSAAPPLLARAFDFEVDPIFDEDKAVFLVRQRGKIPFASVAWPGLVGVVSGMNSAGLALVVHGARAGEPRAQGEPVVHSLRNVLGVAETTEEAVRVLAKSEPMVSHLVVLMDATGRAVVVERTPGHRDTVRPLAERAAVTNHFEGPLADDPKNRRVKEETSTLARRTRGDQLLAELRISPGVEDAVKLLRDKKGAGGRNLALGDRDAIDALIATHGVVMNTRDKQLWVSEGPHLLGRFVLFDLARLLRPDPGADEAPEFIAADPMLDRPEVKRVLEARDSARP